MPPKLSYQASTQVQNNVSDAKHLTITCTRFLMIMQSDFNQTLSARLFCQYFIFLLVSAPSFLLPKYVMLGL